MYLNKGYMKTIRKQKILIIWLKESNKRQKNVEEEILQSIRETVQKKLRAIDGLDSVL